MVNKKHLAIKPIQIEDISTHAELIKRDTENPLSIDAITSRMVSAKRKHNSCNMTVYDNDNLMGFMYGELLHKHIVRTKYYWFKNAKYAIITGSIFCILTDCRVWYPDVVYKSSKWEKLYSVTTGRKLETKKIKYIFTDDDINITFKENLKKLRITYSIHKDLTWVIQG